MNHLNFIRLNNKKIDVLFAKLDYLIELQNYKLKLLLQ